MTEYTLEASVDPCGSLLAEGIAECHYTGPQPVTIYTNSLKCHNYEPGLRLKLQLCAFEKVIKYIYSLLYDLYINNTQAYQSLPYCLF
jgi:hypothetical protein